MIVSVLLSIGYALARAVFGLLVLGGRGEAAKDMQLRVVRHEVTVLRRQVSRPRLQPKDRMLLAALGCATSAAVAEPDRQCGDAAGLAS